MTRAPPPPPITSATRQPSSEIIYWGLARNALLLLARADEMEHKEALRTGCGRG